MKKVAILTINDCTNYGNRLQNYATQEVFKNMNLKAETILNQKGLYGFNYIKKQIKDVLRKCIKNKKQIDRYNLFMKFDKNIKYAKYIIDETRIPQKIGKKYDMFFTGSDQVWNPNFARMSDIDFLTFVPKEKRNSFSASFGIDEIPKEMKGYYKKRISGLNKISVREERGKEIIYELTGRTDVEVLIDPTMMLTAKEWDKVAKKPKQLKNDKYILNYFLGQLSNERKKEIERVAKENNCEIINILDKDSRFYAIGPSEFLYLEKNAFLICTDSFHSCIFAIIYNRPFVVFDREDNMAKMNSRIETLLNKFELRERKYNGKITKDLLKNNYQKSYEILEIEKQKTNAFLKKALNLE